MSKINLNGMVPFGKLLWTGNFTNGTIKVPGLSKYKFFVMNVDAVYCFGSAFYGAGGFGEYGAHQISIRGYRLWADIENETLTINSTETGGSGGGQQFPIKEIFGIF